MTCDEVIRIVIADDHAIFRDGLKVLLETDEKLYLAGEACNGNELIELVKRELPHVVLTDIIMPGLDGIDAVKQIKKLYPNIEIIALSMFDQEQLVIDMMEAGALGYLLKNSARSQIIGAIYSVYNKEPYYNESISKRMLKRIAASTFDPYSHLREVPLTETEISITRYICEGFTNKEIADKLRHTKRTIEIYRKKLMDKLELKSSAALVIYAVKKGIYRT